MQTLLNQFESLRAGRSYDLVMIITDENSITLAKDKGKLHHFPAPVWMVHVSPQMAPVYDDATLDTLQKSGGGVTQKPLELLKRLADSAYTKQQKGQYQGTFIRIADGYIWSYDKQSQAQPQMPKTSTQPEESSTQKKRKPVMPGQLKTPTVPMAPKIVKAPVKRALQFKTSNGFAQLAAKQLINAKIRAHNVGKLAFLDQIHTIAKALSVVSSYSSMIVLVNQTQKNELKKESKRKDRFKRDQESGKQQLRPPASNSPFPVSGTPEPEEWLLIFLGLGLLFHQFRKQRQAQSNGAFA